MTDVIETLQEGDIYRWSYLDPKTDNRSWGDYHCCSRIAVVKNGMLKDTYWYGNDGRSFGLDDLPKLKLTRIGNFSELEQAREYQANYYDDADIVNLNHANSPSGNFYLRKGAVKSSQKMLAVARYNLDLSIANEKYAAQLSEDLRKTISDLEAGRDVLFIPSLPRT